MNVKLAMYLEQMVNRFESEMSVSDVAGPGSTFFGLADYCKGLISDIYIMDVVVFLVHMLIGRW